MTKPKWLMLLVGICSAVVMGQTTQKIADINKKVVGKWWSADHKSYIEFLDNGNCSEGAFYSGSWHVQEGKLSTWETGNSFLCNSGALTLIGANVLTQDHGMGGDPTKYYRGLQASNPVPPSAPGSAQPASPSVKRSGQEPNVEVTAGGIHKVNFNEAQSVAIKAFLGAHPGFQLANCESLGMTESACTDLNKEWERIVRDAGAKVQAPFVIWGDFNQDGLLDLSLPFFGRNNVNSYGWRDWLIVVFQGTRDGHWTPIIAARDQWGVCFDGMLYHPVRKQIEYWCGSGGGSTRWNASRWVMKRLVGD